MTIEKLLAYLFEMVEKESTTLPKTLSASKAGFKLEDALSLKMAEFCSKNQMDYVKVYPPRYELDLPTFSGEKHQFDLMIEYESTYILAESKRRKEKVATNNRSEITLELPIGDASINSIDLNLASSFRNPSSI